MTWSTKSGIVAMVLPISSDSLYAGTTTATRRPLYMIYFRFVGVGFATYCGCRPGMPVGSLFGAPEWFDARVVLGNSRYVT